MGDLSKEVKIIQPYYYPMQHFERTVKEIIRKTGFKPEIITTAKRDQLVFKHMTNSMLFEGLLKRGARVYETRNFLLHSKVYMFDKRWLTLGSMNNDRWSWLINNEVNIGIDDERLYEEVNVYFEALKS
jgi:cardiolipin synthase